MKPKDHLRNQIEAQLVKRFHDIDFRYSPSQLKFSRKVGEFVQQFSFTLSHYSTIETIVFWTSWGVRSPAFAKWRKEMWDDANSDFWIAGSNDWLLPGWSSKTSGREMGLGNGREVLATFWSDADAVGIPFLNQLTSYRGAAEFWLDSGWHFYDASYLFYRQGDLDSVRATLEAGITKFEGGAQDTLGELPRLRARMDRYFPAGGV